MDTHPTATTAIRRRARSAVFVVVVLAALFGAQATAGAELRGDVTGDTSAECEAAGGTFSYSESGTACCWFDWFQGETCVYCDWEGGFCEICDQGTPYEIVSLCIDVRTTGNEPVRFQPDPLDLTEGLTSSPGRPSPGLPQPDPGPALEASTGVRAVVGRAPLLVKAEAVD